MATLRTIGGDGSLFSGEDKVLRFELLEHGLPVNAFGYTLLFDVRSHDDSQEFVLEKQPMVVGVFHDVRALNEQRIEVVLDDDDMNLFVERTYRYSVKRMDEGGETVLFWGDFLPAKATAP